MACPELVEGPVESVDSISRNASNPFTSCAAPSERNREEPMDADKYENSFDNRCAALVSRAGGAPRAGQNRKPCMVNGLRLMSLLIRARGAQVSRAARESDARFSRPVHRALPTVRGVAGATPSRCGTSNVTDVPNVTRCHTHAARGEFIR